jgi:hypothetical protein
LETVSGVGNTGNEKFPRDDAFWDAKTPREARSRLSDALRFELLGPERPDEELRESPLTRYATGMLAPFGTSVADEERDEEVADGEDDEPGSAEFGPPISQSITPSSIGLSFLVPFDTKVLVVRSEWGDYDGQEIPEEETNQPPAEVDDLGEINELEAPPKPTPRRARFVWVRSPKNSGEKTIQLKADGGIQSVPAIEGDAIKIEHLCRKVGDRLAVSVFLVNRRVSERDSRPAVDRWIFQPLLVLKFGSSNGAFLPRELEPALTHSDRDRESNRLLFRKRREFAVGHGCATEWLEIEGGERAREIRSEILPAYELPKVEPRPLAAASFEMEAFARVGSSDELQNLLSPLLTGYANWIADKRGEIGTLPSDLQPVANAHLDDCETALQRMGRGIKALVDDKEAFRAFRFANHAMLLQRSHTTWSQQRRRDSAAAPQSPVLEGRWRPFQLAFILLNLHGLIDPNHADRNVCDLLWFPTGGGKTEAYLGLAAFTIALRRRRSIAGVRTDAGLTVLMRYTLRLLTLQQFQRATTLICACEYLRQKQSDIWGHYRFSIGLWLGMKGTPNSHDEARRSLLLIQADPSEEGPNPCQLESCPWCGESLRPSNYWIDGDALRTRVACPRDGCLFSKEKTPEGIPALVVDEEIYYECPSMLIATVDKFAQMPWNGEVQSLFGFVSRECERCGFLTPSSTHTKTHRVPKGSPPIQIRDTERLAPPELVIQDELHLISGPLGTLVGLYEAAVDFLSSGRQNGAHVRPKIIASTATVRRAFEQVQAVFQRNVRVFPPPALEPEDSFFALERSVSDESPGRLYLGVCAPGKSMKTAYIRVAASLLSSVGGLRKNPALAEPYTTLVSYFNSLRELGGAIRLMDDDIPGRLDQLRNAGFPKRGRPNYVEMTSRIRQEEIPRLLRRLELRHDSPSAGDDSIPLDAVLASNMISVGVDIDRLGVMTVTGQCKTTSEYIQATSRVGRQPTGPGLVVTIYNWSRPRDLSHYERFRHYHSTIYRNVEAVSATPFSSRAIDRCLRGVFVAMARLGSDSWSGETEARNFDSRDARVHAIIESIRSRADLIADRTTSDQIVRALTALGDEWWGYTQQPLRYGWRAPDPSQVPQEDVLLRTQEGGSRGHWAAPQSLREVEEQCPVRVLGLG